MKSADKPTALQEIVEDILKDMSKTNKTAVMGTAEKNLVQFYFNWGAYI